MGPVRSGGDRLCQTRLIPRSPDGDKNAGSGFEKLRGGKLRNDLAFCYQAERALLRCRENTNNAKYKYKY